MGSRGRGRAYSSVETYRRLKPEDPPYELPYDLADPLDRAIWYALQTYIDYLEMLDLEREPQARKEPNVYGRHGTGELTARSPFILEKYIKDLRSWGKGEKVLTVEGRHQAALHVLEALFAPARNLAGEAVVWGEGEYAVPRVLWDAGREEQEEDVGGPLPPFVAQEPPLLVPERAAPIFQLLEKALGGLVSQSEAARRLNLTPRGVSKRLQRGGLKHVRVGGSVMVLEEDERVPAGE